MVNSLKIKVLRLIKDRILFHEGDRVVVAVSGGPDSVALLDVLASLEQLRLHLVVAHMNHLLRGDESDGDEEFVRRLAGRYSLPFEIKRVDVKRIAAEEGRSLEDAGRVERYRFFNEVADGCGADAVALGHHVGDQAETVLMRLMRGAAWSGLCAMMPRTGRYVRPILSLTRDEIEGYLREREMVWRDDSSNSSVDFLRNRIRHELIPLLKSYNPAIVERLAATAESLAADEEVLDSVTERAFASHCRIEDRTVSLSVPDVREEPAGIRLRLYRSSIRIVKGDLMHISFRHLKGIDRLLNSQGGFRRLDLPGGLEVSRSYDRLFFATAEEQTQDSVEFTVEGPGEFHLKGGKTLAVAMVVRPVDVMGARSSTVFFDLDMAPFPWRIRGFQAGDRISPLGMTGHKKVKDLFIDEKIPVPGRRSVPLVFSGGTLLWVAGVRRSGFAVVSPNTRNIVRAELRESP